MEKRENELNSFRFGNRDNNANKKGRFVKRRFVFRKKECFFTKNKISDIDYKDIPLLKNYIGKNGYILSTELTGISPIFQRKLARAIKKARALALLPYVGKTDGILPLKNIKSVYRERSYATNTSKTDDQKVNNENEKEESLNKEEKVKKDISPNIS